ALTAHQKYLEKYTFIKKPKTTPASLSFSKSFHAKHLVKLNKFIQNVKIEHLTRMKNDYNFQTLRFPGKSQRKPKISKNAETSRTVISIQPLSKEIKSDVGLEVAYDFNIPADLLPFKETPYLE
ncbi:3907_t:CDS:2, partial [Rhizophagus irregularis]